MPLIDWKVEFSVGVPSVDHEHQALIELINELYASVKSGGSKSTIVEFLGEVFTKISAHFALEEKVMRERNYDEYGQHKQNHELLLDEIRDIMDEYEDNQNFDEEELSRRLDNWFTEHFRTYDARLHRYLPH